MELVHRYLSVFVYWIIHQSLRDIQNCWFHLKLFHRKKTWKHDTCDEFLLNVVYNACVVFLLTGRHALLDVHLISLYCVKYEANYYNVFILWNCHHDFANMRNKEQCITIYEFYICSEPVPMAARSEARTVFDRSNTVIAGSNPARGIDKSPRSPVLCCPVWLEALRRAHPPSKESYQMSVDS
jgi:hypothetical protein